MPLLLPLALALGVTGCRGASTADGEPTALEALLPARSGLDVLVVSFDALRADVLGVYGDPRRLSPHLDRFARRAVVFDRAFTAAPVTPTSFAGAFTGRHPHEVFRAWKFVAEEPLAERFAAAGYSTAAFLNNVQLTSERGFDRGFEHYSVNLDDTMSDEGVLKEATEWLRSAERPFFAWIHFINPHAPYDRRELGSHLYDESYRGEFFDTSGAVFDSDDPRDLEQLRALYAGEVLYADRLFGELMRRLQEMGLADETLIVVTADHGEEFRERGVFQHKHLYDETTRIPLLVAHPDLRSARRSDALVSNLDLYPTLLAVAGLPVPEGLDGRVLRDAAVEERALVGQAMTESMYRALTVRTDEWRLILECRPEQRVLLYDLVADPEQRVDRAEETRPVVRGLLQTLQDEVGADPCASMKWAVQGVEPTEGLRSESVEALKALGYL